MPRLNKWIAALKILQLQNQDYKKREASRTGRLIFSTPMNMCVVSEVLTGMVKLQSVKKCKENIATEIF